jgi:hypothetical protein
MLFGNCWVYKCKNLKLGCRECQLSRVPMNYMGYSSVFQTHELSRAFGKTHLTSGAKTYKICRHGYTRRVREKPRGFANWH